MKHTDNQHRHLPLRTMALVGATSLALAAAYVRMSPAEEAAPMSGPVAADLAPGTSSFADVIERVSPAVVNIAVTQLARTTSGRPGPQGWRGGPPVEEFFGRFFQFEAPNMPAPQPRREGLGSGFLIDAGGYVVTNNHVIDGADEIVVTLNDGRQYDATLAGHDPKTDLALLKIAADEPLPYVRFADSDHSRVGDWVLAIGNPFGLGGTATAGIISARGRDIQSGPYDDYLQIDAPINSGNSGGPVFNARGEVIGINTAIFSPNGGNIGIGFAIPANQARLVVDQLRESGAVERGWLGVEIQDLDTDLAASLGLESPQGALIANVSSDGPARKAGFEPGDVVTRFARSARRVPVRRSMWRSGATVATARSRSRWARRSSGRPERDRILLQRRPMP
jgi:serine protease Do